MISNTFTFIGPYIWKKSCSNIERLKVESWIELYIITTKTIEIFLGQREEDN